MSQPFSEDIEFQKLLRGQTDVDLVDLMLEFAADSPEPFDAVACRKRLDEWGTIAAGVVAQLGHGCSIRDRLSAISRVLYDDVGLRGNRDEYYSPANSYLPAVVEKKVGIPISLAIVYMAVAARAGVDVYGVPAPGHFMLGCADGNDIWYVDPFDDGDILDFADCRRRIEQRLESLAPVDQAYFRPATAREIAVRVLRNLKGAHAMVDRWGEARPVQERLVLLLPDEPSERRDLGLIYLRTHAAQQALQVLGCYSEGCSAEERATIEPYLRTARRLVSELN